MRDLSDVYDYARETEHDTAIDGVAASEKAKLRRLARQELTARKKESKQWRRTVCGASGKRRAVIWTVAAVGVVAVAVGLAAQSARFGHTEPDAAATPAETAQTAAPTSEPTVENAAANLADVAPETEVPAATEELTVVQSYHGYNLGDIVRYTGTVHYKSSDTNELRGPATAGLAMISAINPNGAHAFHLVHADDESNVYGWVDESFLSPA